MTLLIKFLSNRSLLIYSISAIKNSSIIMPFLCGLMELGEHFSFIQGIGNISVPFLSLVSITIILQRNYIYWHDRRGPAWTKNSCHKLPWSRKSPSTIYNCYKKKIECFTISWQVDTKVCVENLDVQYLSHQLDCEKFKTLIKHTNCKALGKVTFALFVETKEVYHWGKLYSTWLYCMLTQP